MEYEFLISHFSHLFANNENGQLKIITDFQQIASWQKKEKARLAKQGLPQEWADIGVVLDDPYIVMVRDLVQFPNGQMRGYIRLLSRADLLGGQGVAVLPCIESSLLLLRQFRHATRSWHLEIPRGFGEPDTSPMQQAQTEIQEEIDGVVEELLDLGELHVNTSMEGHATKLFLAKLRSVGQPEHSEGIQSIKRVRVNKFKALISNGSITDSFTIAAYTRARLRGLI